MAGEWWEDHANLHELWAWLEDGNGEPTDPGEFLEEPWHWTPEWQDMREAKRAAAAT